MNSIKRVAAINDISGFCRCSLTVAMPIFCAAGIFCCPFPTAILSKYVLGIHIEEAGCKKIKIAPQLGNLTFAKGTFPTPYGNISVEHKNENGKIISKVSAPPEIEIVYN